MQVTVKYNKVPVAPKKIRFVLPPLKGKRVNVALALVRAFHRPSSESVTKLLLSSISAARDKNPNLSGDDIIVKEFFCNEGPRMYRTMIKGRGRASRFVKRSSHLSLTVETVQKNPVKPVKEKKVAKTTATKVKTKNK